MKHLSWRIPALLAPVLILLALGGHGSSLSSPSTTDAWGPGTAGMRVILDPETGVVASAPTLSAEEMAWAMEPMLRRTGEDLTPTYHENGTVSLHLQGRFQSASVAHFDRDGVLRTSCVDHAEGLSKQLSGCDHTHRLEVK